MVFLCYVLLKEANIHINLICFNRNFDHPHITAVTLSPENSPKSHDFFHKNIVFLEKAFNMYLLLGLSSLFSQNSLAVLKKKCYFCCTFEKLTKNFLFDSFGVRFVPPFSKKSQPFKMTKKAKKIGQT